MSILFKNLKYGPLMSGADSCHYKQSSKHISNFFKDIQKDLYKKNKTKPTETQCIIYCFYIRRILNDFFPHKYMSTYK